MSFLAGFADAVSADLVDRRKRKRDMEEDTYKYQFQTFLENDKERKKREAEQRKNKGVADLIAKKYANGDSEAAKVYMDMLNNGMTYEQVSKTAENYEISVPEAATPAIEGDPAIEIAQEMNSLGIDPEKVATSTTGRSTAAETTMTPEQKQMSQLNEANIAKIAETTGRDPKEIRATLEGRTTNDLSSAISYNLKSRSDDVNKRVMSVKPDELDYTIAALEQSSDPTDKKVLDKLKIIKANMNKTDMGDFRPEVKWMQIREDDGSFNGVQVLYGPQGVKLLNPPQGTKEEDNVWMPLSTFGTNTYLTDDRSPVPLDEQKYIDDRVKGPNESVVSLINLGIGYNRLSEIYRNNKYSATNVAKLVRGVKQFALEGDAAKAVWDQVASGSMTIGEARQSLVDMIPTDLDENSREVALIQMDMTFDYLASKGQTGKDVSAVEFEKAFSSLGLDKAINFEPTAKSNFKKMVDQLMVSTRDLRDLRGRPGTPFWIKEDDYGISSELERVGGGWLIGKGEQPVQEPNTAEQELTNPSPNVVPLSEVAPDPADVVDQWVAEDDDGTLYDVYELKNGDTIPVRKN